MSISKSLLDFYQVVKKQDVCPPSKRRKVLDAAVIEPQTVNSGEKFRDSWVRNQTSIDGFGDTKPQKQLTKHAKSIFIEPDASHNNCERSLKRKLSETESPTAKISKETSSRDKNKMPIFQSVASQLAKSTKIHELKETLSRLKTAKDKLKSKSSSVSRTDASTSQPTVSNSEVVETVPAYQRFHALAFSDTTSQLALPYKYKFLAEVFQSTDTVASILHNRQEICTITKLKPAVQEMMHRNFDLKYLAQIKTVYPSAYTLKQEKVRSSRDRMFETQLTIAINTDCLEKGSQRMEKDDKGLKNGFVAVDPKFLLSRRRVFRSNLVDLLMKHHSEFLSSLNPPIEVSSDKVTRWHPSFPIEDVSDIELSKLPESEAEQKCVSAKDVLDKIKGLYSSKLDKALENVAKMKADSSTAPSTATSKFSQSNNKLKGIPSSLLAKIRAKEAEKIKAEITRDPIANKRKVMISRLPEMTRILRNYFISERKAAIPLSVAVNKVMESFGGSLTPVEMESHLMLLAELVPNWLNCVRIKSGVFLKMNRQTDVNCVIETIVRAEKQIT